MFVVVVVVVVVVTYDFRNKTKKISFPQFSNDRARIVVMVVVVGDRDRDTHNQPVKPHNDTDIKSQRYNRRLYVLIVENRCVIGWNQFFFFVVVASL